jgi:hypothetical protein
MSAADADRHYMYGALFDAQRALEAVYEELDRAALFDQPVTRESLAKWARLVERAKESAEDWIRAGRPPRGAWHFVLCREYSATQAMGDPQRNAVYGWQREVLGELCNEPWLGADERGAVTKAAARKAALAYLQAIWTRYSPAFSPWFPGVSVAAAGLSR